MLGNKIQIKAMLDLPEPWEEICPYCGVRFIAELAVFGTSLINAWREQEKEGLIYDRP